MKEFAFIDLFAGIGGFHQALSSIGGKCVLAAEIDKDAVAVYEKNYGIPAGLDVTSIDENTMPDFDVLCAGFPCQPFSKAGERKGFSDTRGTMFFHIERILRARKPKYILLENVRNLASHDKGNTWRVIHSTLQEIGYRIPDKPLVLSPHQFGVPQLRERVLIPGYYDPENKEEGLHLKFDGLRKKDDNDIYDIVHDVPVSDDYRISEYEKFILDAWDEFYKGIDLKIIGFPIWADVFLGLLKAEGVPEWKAAFIRKNEELFDRNKEFVSAWLEKYDYLRTFSPTHRKFEWQAGEKIDSVWDGVIQFRPSGVRVKAPTCFPALVAMVQIPVIGRYARRLTVEEAKALQSFQADFVPDEKKQAAYKQFGNAVNVDVVKMVASKLFEECPL